MRKFIQIFETANSILGLADDGTVWGTEGWDIINNRPCWKYIGQCPQQEVKP